MSNLEGVAAACIAAEGLPRAHVGAITTTRDSPGVNTLVPLPLLQLEQVHGCNVVSVDKSNRDDLLAQRPRADAAVTRLADVALAIRTADCLPVLLSDERGDVIGAAHAGWRGLAAGVLGATVEAMQVEPASLRAWIGPGIGPRAFEVGVDVLDAFAAADPSARAAFVPHTPGKWLADLPRLARMRLARAGVRSVNGGVWCTFSDAATWHSWRRDRTAERMTTAIWRNPGSAAR